MSVRQCEGSVKNRRRFCAGNAEKRLSDGNGETFSRRRGGRQEPAFLYDGIWFTERDYESGKTEMYPLSDFSPRTSENIEKAYLLGRFGAIPFIKGV